MNLLEKFDHVEIKADDRISDVDRAFCEANQEAYEKARSVFKQVAELAGTGQMEQVRILEHTEREIYNTYLGSKYDFGVDKFLKSLDETHLYFVQRIVGYFQNKYHVSLDDRAIYDAFVQKIPKQPLNKYSYRNPRDLTDEEIDELRAINNSYSEMVKKVEEDNRTLVIRYEKILDYIFAQLGGGSFRDTAIKELKDACHAACWYSHNGQPKFEQKKSVIRYTGYGCSVDYIHEKYKDKNEESEFSLTDDMKSVLKALKYYELGTQDVGMDSIDNLCGYRVRGQEHKVFGEKVTGVRLYKTNRVDIRFSNEAYARDFVEQFMGTVA